MRPRTVTATRRWARPLGAALIVVMATAGTAMAAPAGPAREDLVAARATLAALNEKMSLLVERYDQTGVRLQRAERALVSTRTEAALAAADLVAARKRLDERAAAAYEAGPGSQLSFLLGATNFSDLSDRLVFVGAVAKGDSNALDAAASARARLDRAVRRTASLVAERRDLLASLSEQRDQVEAGIAGQLATVRSLEAALARPVAVDPATPAASEPPPPAATPAPSESPIPVPPGPTTPAPSPPPSPVPPPTVTPSPAPSPSPSPTIPPPAPGAATAVAAAYSVIGTPYQWGGADPASGFDCSGLTMWAWAQAGVSLPHSSAMQYDSLPHVATSDLQPGDLVFFYTPISHVGLYVGNGQMIDAPHTGSVVGVRPVLWSSYVGAARP